MNEFINCVPRSPLSQAACIFTQNWSLGINGMGTIETVSTVWVAAINA